MDAHEAMITRRSTRRFKPDAVEPEKLERVIKAGRFAPSGGNSQSNHFLVIRDEGVLAELIALVEEAFAKMEVAEDTYASLKSSINQSKRGGYVFDYGAPVLIVIANKRDYGNNMADVAVALENMMIAANALDLGSCYINQLKWLNEDPALLGLLHGLGLGEDERVYGSLALGYPDTADGLPIREPLPRKGNEVTYIG
ncbi:MAG: nitroreductase [Coriobacteriales bacterium]|jgi:nitroreductase